MSEGMVKPVPQPPSTGKDHGIVIPPPADPLRELRSILELFGNTRSFTLISKKKHRWVIHFEGDYEHTIVPVVDGKPEMIKESEE